MSSQLVLVRHGESEVNLINCERRFFCGQFDTPLTPRGREQARQVGKRLALVPELRIQHAISSTLTRARETLELMKASLPADCQFMAANSDLNERSLGDFEGRWETDVVQQHPAYRDDPQLNRFLNDFVQKAPAGENLREVTERMSRAILPHWDQLDGDWLVVTHGCAMRCLLGHLLKWSEERVIDTHIPNAIPILLRRSDRGHVEMVDVPAFGDD